MDKIGQNFAFSMPESTPLVFYRQQLVCQDYLTEWEMVTSIWRSINCSVVLNQGQKPLYCQQQCNGEVKMCGLKFSILCLLGCILSVYPLPFPRFWQNIKNVPHYLSTCCKKTPDLCKRSSTCLTTRALVTRRLQICAKDQIRASLLEHL